MFPERWWIRGKYEHHNAAGNTSRPARRLRPYRPRVEILEGRLAATVTLSISDPVPFPKPDTGQLLGMFVVSRSGDLAPPVLVDYTTRDGTGPNGAHAGTDYVATSGTLVFASYQPTATINVTVLGSNLFQADKTFTVSLAQPVLGVAFTPQQSFATGSQPMAVAVGDFNGDGKPDLAVANYVANNVSVLLNTTPAGATTPSFAPQQTFATGQGPSAVAVGDVNGDGRPDLAVADKFSDAVSVVLNTTPAGATVPSFAPQQTFRTSNYPISVAVGDVNSDGKPDLVTAAAAVSVLLNTTPVGATIPSFAPQQTFTTAGIPFAVAVGDFNDDGKADLAVVASNFSGPGMASVLLNTTPAGASTPSFAPEVTFDTFNYSRALTVGDVNGDGKPDLAVTSGGMITVLLNTTPIGATVPAFGPYQAFATTGGSQSVAMGDFNGDGKVDLAAPTIMNRAGAISVLLNRTPIRATIPSFAPQQSFRTNNTYPFSVVVADFNGDGKPDLAVANHQAGSVSVLLNQTPPVSLDASFAPQQTFATAGGGPDWVAVGDFNGDGKPDLAISSLSSNEVAVLLNTTPAGATVPSFAPRQTFATGMYPVSVAVGDVNGDGKPDLAVANSRSDTVSVLLNTTPVAATIPTFAPQLTFATGSRPNAVAVGDFNGDGRPDLAIANKRSFTVSVLLNTTPAGATSPSFAAQQTFGAPLAYAVTVGDLNGDGKPDLAVANDYGSSRTGITVSVLLNTTSSGATTPSFAPPQTFDTGIRPLATALGDFNGDGKPDIAVANYQSGTASVLLNTTPAGATIPTFTPQQTFTTGNEPGTVAVGDFNGDGKPDLALSDWGFGSVWVLTDSTVAGATTPGFTRAQAFPTGAHPSFVAVGDFNGDGKPDIASTNFSAATVSVLLNSLPIALDQSLATGTISAALEAPTIVEVVLGTTPQSGVVHAAFNTPLAVDVRNSAGHLVQGVSVAFIAPPSGASGLFGSTTSVIVMTNASGQATAPAFTANTIAGSYTVTAQVAGGSNPSTSFNLTNLPAAASSFTLTDLPAALTAGTPTTFTVTARDPFGNVATGYTGTVHLLSTDPSATLPADYPFTAADHGAHTSAGLILPTAGIHFVTAYDTADPRIDGISPGVRVVAAAADHFAETTSATDPDAAGTPFDVSVTVQDAYGNTVTGYGGTVTFSSQDPYGATLPADYNFQAADQGQVTFAAGAALYTAGVWDVTATDITGAITGTALANVVAAPAVTFQVVAPGSAVSGMPFDVTVAAVDPYGNTDTNYQGTITFLTSDQDPGVVLPPDYTFQPTDQGTATFGAGVTLVIPGEQTLTVTDTDSGITGSTTVLVSGPGPAAGVRRRAEWAARWPQTCPGEAVRAEALDALFGAWQRRRSHGLTGDDRPSDSPQ